MRPKFPLVDMEKNGNYLSMLLCCALIGYWIFRSLSFPLHDFANTYFATFLAKPGSFDQGIFDPYTFNKAIADAGFKGVFASFNPNPPFIAWFFYPLSFLAPHSAKLVFTIASTMLFLFSTWRLTSHLGFNKQWVFAILPFLLFIPMRNQIMFGQSYFLLFFLLVEGFLAFEKKNWMAASLFWSLAIFIKVFPVIIFAWLAFQKKWRMISHLGSVCLAILCLSIVIQGFEVWHQFIFEILPSHQKGLISSEFTTNYQSIHMWLKYLFVREPMLNPSVLVDSPMLMKIGVALFSTICMAYICTASIQQSSIVSFSFLLASSLLLSPYSSTYSLLLLLPAWLVMIKDKKLNSIILATSLVFLASNLPRSILQRWGFDFPRLLLMVSFFVVMVLVLKIRIRMVHILLLLPFFLALVFLPGKELDGARLLPNEDHNLVFDLYTKEGRLAYKYWDEEGEHSVTTNISAANVSNNAVRIRDNQVEVNGNPLTSSPSHKLAPLLINRDSVVFLSDHNKGKGFYTIRYVRLSK